MEILSGMSLGDWGAVAAILGFFYMISKDICKRRRAKMPKLRLDGCSTFRNYISLNISNDKEITLLRIRSNNKYFVRTSPNYDDRWNIDSGSGFGITVQCVAPARMEDVPLDLTLLYENESGQRYRVRLYGRSNGKIKCSEPKWVFHI